MFKKDVTILKQLAGVVEFKRPTLKPTEVSERMVLEFYADMESGGRENLGVISVDGTETLFIIQTGTRKESKELWVKLSAIAGIQKTLIAEAFKHSRIIK